MSIFESDKDTAKLYVQFLDQNRLQFWLLVQEWVDLHQRFWSRSKNSHLLSVQFKNSWRNREFLNLITHSSSFFQHYNKYTAISHCQY